MNNIEIYKKNIDIDDKYHVNNVVINKSTVLNNYPLKKINNIHYSNTPLNESPPLAAAIVGLNNTAAANLLHCEHFWTNLDAQEHYLNSSPTSYLILSKPGLGSFTLGEELSKRFNCVHLCPFNVITDDINQKSSTGRCIDFNMRHNKVLSYDTILAIIRKKIESPSVIHRGYVLSGLPLIASTTSPTYFVNSLYSEESIEIAVLIITDLLSDMKIKKSRKPGVQLGSKPILNDTTDEDELDNNELEPDIIEEQEESISLPQFILQPTSNAIFLKKPYVDTNKAVLLEQLNSIFRMQIKPDIIIYLTSPDKDTINKKSKLVFNYLHNRNERIPFSQNLSSCIRWPSKYTTNLSFTDDCNYEEILFDMKYYCHQPNNCKEFSTKQLCNYQLHILPIIEQKLQEYDPKHVLKLDGRNTVHYMVHQVTQKILNIIMKPVILPKPLFLNSTMEQPEDIEEFWKMIDEFNVSNDENMKMHRCASPWLNRCPVELKLGRTVQGKIKYAVIFFNHVYLLSSYEYMTMFCINPRPFLKMKYLQPTCRIITIGTKSSGKTMISLCLSWLFDAQLISYINILENQRKIKYESFAKNIMPEIIGPIADTRNILWQEMEAERIEKLEQWVNNTFEALNYFVYLTNNLEELSEEMPDSITTQIETTKEKLKYIANLDDIVLCIDLVSNKNNLLNYAPKYLITETQRPQIPVIEDDDVRQAINSYIVANELHSRIEPTVEEIVEELVKILNKIDNEAQTNSNYEQIYGKWVIDDFPTSPEFWTCLFDANISPDYTISLTENRDITPSLLKVYQCISRVEKKHLDRLTIVNDPLVYLKLISTKLPKVSPDITSNMHELIESIFEHLDIFDDEDISSNIKSFSESLEKYREDCDGIKIKLGDNFKAFIAVEIQDLTDVDVIEEVLMKLRQTYNLTLNVSENEDVIEEEEEEGYKDFEVYNPPHSLCETSIYCPIAYYKHNVLWKGKPEIKANFNNKLHYFSKEICLETFQKDPIQYQSYNKPFKTLPPLRICLIGTVGSGLSSLSKFIAKELGLIHVEFSKVINELFMPRHFKKVGRQYENSFIDTPFDDENVTELQVDEETPSYNDILSNENELRRTIFNYFERGSPLPSSLLRNLLNQLWVKQPYSNIGFVLDGFPRLPTDVEVMLECFCIPDLIIEIECDLQIVTDRLVPIMFNTWKSQLKQAKQLSKFRFQKIHNEWLKLVIKNVVIELILDELLSNILIFEDVNDDIREDTSIASVVIDVHPTGSTNVDANMIRRYNEVLQIYPQPIDESNWESPDDVHERIETRIENLYELNIENLQNVKELLSEQNIKIVTLDGSKSLKKICKTALLLLSNLRNRNESFFEQTFVTSFENAELLLSEGIIMTSTFNTMCPVNLFEYPETILNPYILRKAKNDIFPVIHRCYVYFVCGNENLKRFRSNPLLYVSNVENMCNNFIEFPLRLAIIGPPKSGKSTLANNLNKEFGVLPISMGIAIRHVLDKMPWSELANQMQKSLTQGETLSLDVIVNAIQIVAMDYRALTYGFVLDGLPKNSAEMKLLTNLGLNPLVIFCMSNTSKILDNVKNEIYFDILKTNPPYSVPFIENRLLNWGEEEVINYVKDLILKTYSLDSNKTKWECWIETKKIVEQFISKLHKFLITQRIEEKAVPAEVIYSSKDIFEQRMSVFKNFCPLCLQDNIIKRSDYPVDRDHVIQYKSLFYWVCKDHFHFVIKNPKCLDQDSVKMPEIAAIITIAKGVALYEDGICIVTYAENLPSQILIQGLHKYMASYGGNYYSFCSLECHVKFLERPYLYSNITVFRDIKLFPEISLMQLPHIGYLEQTIGNIITDACCYVNVVRPKYPGLSVELSALIYLGLYIKIHNPRTHPSTLKFYTKAYQIYEARCKLIFDVGRRLRSIDNPLAKYPVCCLDKDDDSNTVRKPYSFSSHNTISTFSTIE